MNAIRSILCLLVFISQAMERKTDPNDANKVFLLFGTTRAGKSTFINKLAGFNAVVAGDPNSAMSTTIMPQPIRIRRPDFFADQKIIFIDVQGLSDTRNDDDKSTMASIADFVESTLLANGLTRLDGVLLFQSLQPLPKLGDMLSQLQGTFGDQIASSTFVLATKPDIFGDDERSQQALRTKLQAVDDFCRAKSIPWMKWGSYNGRYRDEQNKFVNVECSDEEMSGNVMILSDALSTLQPYELSGMQETFDAIQARALEIFSGQSFEKRTVYVEISIDEFEKRVTTSDQIRYVQKQGSTRSPEELQARALEIQKNIGEIPVSELTSIRITKETIIHEIKTRMVKMKYKKKKGGITGAFGSTKTKKKYIPTEYLDHQSRIEDDEKMIWKKIMKLMDIQQCKDLASQEVFYLKEEYKEPSVELTVKKNTTRTPVEIDIPKISMEACLNLALKERQQQLRQRNSYHNIFNH